QAVKGANHANVVSEVRKEAEPERRARDQVLVDLATSPFQELAAEALEVDIGAPLFHLSDEVRGMEVTRPLGRRHQHTDITPGHACGKLLSNGFPARSSSPCSPERASRPGRRPSGRVEI